MAANALPDRASPIPERLLRWTGLAAVVAGLIFAAIQPIHPKDEVASLTTSAWTTIISLKLMMCLLFLVGLTGIYLRQARAVGWLGLIGFALLIVSWWLQTGFVFAELFVLPLLANVAPDLAASFLSLANGTPAPLSIGPALPTYAVVGLAYMLGGLLFGIATFRAGVLPRWAGALLAVVSLITPAAALVPHELQRLIAIPVGLAIAWLGYAVWSRPAAAAARFA